MWVIEKGSNNKGKGDANEKGMNNNGKEGSGSSSSRLDSRHVSFCEMQVAAPGSCSFCEAAKITRRKLRRLEPSYVESPTEVGDAELSSD